MMMKLALQYPPIEITNSKKELLDRLKKNKTAYKKRKNIISFNGKLIDLNDDLEIIAIYDRKVIFGVNFFLNNAGDNDKKMSKYKDYFVSLYGSPTKEKNYKKNLQMYWHLDDKDINFFWFNENEIAMHLEFKSNDNNLVHKSDARKIRYLNNYLEYLNLNPNYYQGYMYFSNGKKSGHCLTYMYINDQKLCFLIYAFNKIKLVEVLLKDITCFYYSHETRLKIVTDIKTPPLLISFNDEYSTDQAFALLYKNIEHFSINLTKINNIMKAWQIYNPHLIQNEEELDYFNEVMTIYHLSNVKESAVDTFFENYAKTCNIPLSEYREFVENVKNVLNNN